MTDSEMSILLETSDRAEISVLRIENEDYVSLTDMAGGKDGDSRAADIIKNWLRARYTLEFLGTWEMLNNPNFKGSSCMTVGIRSRHNLI